MLAGHLRHGRKLGRFASDGLVNPAAMEERHEALVREMLRRGFRHGSELNLDGLELPQVEIDVTANLAELHRRCAMCKARTE
jgi:hypothetical protein